MSRNVVKQVALVSPYDFAANGGVTEHIRQLSAHLQLQGTATTIIAPHSAEYLPESNLVSLGTVIPIRINGSTARPTLSPRVLEAVSQLLQRQSFDVIHLHEPLCPMLPLSVLNASASVNVGTFHASGQKSLGYASSRRLLRWLAQRLDARIAVSPAAAEFVQHYVPGDYTIIPNGVDTNRFRPDLPAWPQWSDGRPNVLFVGRFDEPRKGLDILLQAWEQIEAARPDARLLVVGRGDIAQLEARIAARGPHNIVVIGPVLAADLPRWYRTASLFCAPSTGQESFGIILVEAMSSGVPIIASEIAGYQAVVQHRHEGLLVPPTNPAALGAAVLHLLANPATGTAFAQAGRTTALRYAWSDVTARIMQTYEQAIWHHQYAQVRVPVRYEQRLLVPLLMGSAGTALPLSGESSERPAEQSTGSSPQGAAPMLTKPFEEQVRAFTQRVVGRVLGRSNISPNLLTTLGLLLTLSVTLTLAKGHLRWGGLLVLITSAFDMLDGALARATDQKSAFGAFLDSTVDRYAEALIFLGLLLHYQGQTGSQWLISLIYITIVGSLMVSYTRARAEALGFTCKVGLLGRPERVILLAFGLLVGWLPFALAILALFTNVTAVQRILHVWQEDRARQPQTIQPKTERRGWFAPRGQKPS
ncbi:MAG: glycosyltransferase [Herpetosiphonaceae bacterium]|nr:glycosyltransferase [Herpetosiphonaceae bacterium]